MATRTCFSSYQMYWYPWDDTKEDTENFPVWANQANGMLQLAVWAALRELNIGASLQHYNPVIDNEVKRQFHVPDQYRIVAQMPFGGIAEEPATKEWEYIDQRVRVLG